MVVASAHRYAPSLCDDSRTCAGLHILKRYLYVDCTTQTYYIICTGLSKYLMYARSYYVKYGVQLSIHR